MLQLQRHQQHPEGAQSASSPHRQRLACRFHSLACCPCTPLWLLGLTAWTLMAAGRQQRDTGEREGDRINSTGCMSGMCRARFMHNGTPTAAASQPVSKWLRLRSAPMRCVRVRMTPSTQHTLPTHQHAPTFGHLVGAESAGPSLVLKELLIFFTPVYSHDTAGRQTAVSTQLHDDKHSPCAGSNC